MEALYCLPHNIASHSGAFRLGHIAPRDVNGVFPIDSWCLEGSTSWCSIVRPSLTCSNFYRLLSLPYIVLFLRGRCIFVLFAIVAIAFPMTLRASTSWFTHPSVITQFSNLYRLLSLYSPYLHIVYHCCPYFSYDLRGIQLVVLSYIHRTSFPNLYHLLSICST